MSKNPGWKSIGISSAVWKFGSFFSSESKEAYDLGYREYFSENIGNSSLEDSFGII